MHGYKLPDIRAFKNGCCWCFLDTNMRIFRLWRKHQITISYLPDIIYLCVCLWEISLHSLQTIKIFSAMDPLLLWVPDSCSFLTKLGRFGFFWICSCWTKMIKMYSLQTSCSVAWSWGPKPGMYGRPFIYKLVKMTALGNKFGGCLLSMTTQNKCNLGK